MERELAIETPLGTVREIGTQYEVRLLGESVRIRVREGKVTLDDGSRVHEVPAAQELAVDEAGSMTTREIPVHGPEWDWAARIATLPNLDGASARTFLDHVAREQGWRLRFADDRTQHEAARIRIGGSIERLSLDHALDSVLPTCGMTYRIEDGTLIVSLEGSGS
jgi:ferric-dicitrate binding protein FerR (iron transport regulator)